VRGKRAKRLLRGCALGFAAALACAVVTGVLIANGLIGALERLTTAPPVTPLPLNTALANIHSLRAAFQLENAVGETLLAGEAIFSVQHTLADIYATWRSSSGESAYLRVDGLWYARDGLDWSAAENIPPILRAFESAQSLDDLLHVLNLALTENMAEWSLLDTATDAGRRVERYMRPLSDLTPWEAWLGAEAVEAEITLGMRDHLPYQIRYTVRKGGERLTLTITLSSFNDPLDIAKP
jgi:hypothetical protein